MKKKILVIDDEPNICILIKEYFSPKGYMVLTATNQTQGLKKLITNKIDILILDIMMPYISGFEVLQVVKNIYKTFLTPVIMLTAKNMKEDVLKALDLKCDDYCVKPFSFEMLYSRVNKLANQEIEKNKPLPLIDLSILPEKFLVKINFVPQKNILPISETIDNILKIISKTSNYQIEIKAENIANNPELKSNLERVISAYTSSTKITSKELTIYKNFKDALKTTENIKSHRLGRSERKKYPLEIIPCLDITILSFSEKEVLNQDYVDYFLHTLIMLKKTQQKKFVVDFTKVNNFEESAIFYLMDKLQELRIKGISLVIKDAKFMTLIRSLKVNLWANIFSKIDEALKII